MADRPNGAGGSHHVWPAPHMSTLPKGSVANVYQSMQTAGTTRRVQSTSMVQFLRCLDGYNMVTIWYCCQRCGCLQALTCTCTETYTRTGLPRWLTSTYRHTGAHTPPLTTHAPTHPRTHVAHRTPQPAHRTTAPLLDAGVPVVLSVASSDWYLDYHPDFEDVYKVIPCGAAQLDCSNHPHRRANILGGSVSQWGESVDAFNINPDLWIGASLTPNHPTTQPPHPRSLRALSP